VKAGAVSRGGGALERGVFGVRLFDPGNPRGKSSLPRERGRASNTQVDFPLFSAGLDAAAERLQGRAAVRERGRPER